ncbi:AAA family ATPase [Pseudomonas fluorescens]|uniref:AAA family ATPase n=1 Tax=Pseudomonas fluorescens TaxID=294 RepID=UPI000B2D7BA7|nr:ATP-binding protein [Pseudomonas fluorescens]
MPTPVLHLLCGKIASGKSTLARSLKAEHSAILLSEDHWLSKLYPDQIKSVADYVLHARRIRDVLGPLVIDMLSTGTPVVLDFPANTPADRHWLRSLADTAKVPHRIESIGSTAGVLHDPIQLSKKSVSMSVDNCAEAR